MAMTARYICLPCSHERQPAELVPGKTAHGTCRCGHSGELVGLATVEDLDWMTEGLPRSGKYYIEYAEYTGLDRSEIG